MHNGDIYKTQKIKQQGNLKEYSFFNNNGEKVFCEIFPETNAINYLSITNEEIVGGIMKTQVRNADLKVYLVKFGNNEAHFQFESKKEGINIMIPVNEFTFARFENLFKEKSLTQTCVGNIEKKYNYSQFSKNSKEEKPKEKKDFMKKEGGRSNEGNSNKQ